MPHPENTGREMINPDASLDDRYQFDGKPYYLNGTQSLVRLTMLELRRRTQQGLNTAVYATGYRGSPLGTFDQAMLGARAWLGEQVIVHPAVNEDLAATAVWGTQQAGTFGVGRYDGVSALWYGKGPGVDRTGDVFKHGNLAGSAREGGVLVVAGDDHTCKSSTTAHQSEFGLIDAMIPILAPASIAEQMALGLTGWELSRYTGLWVGLKVVTEIMDSSTSVARDPTSDLVEPIDFKGPTSGLSLRWPDTPLDQEARLHRYKIPAALAWARVNRLDRRVLGDDRASIGVVAVGKAYADTRQALMALGVDDTRAAALGLSVYKVAMPWPLEPEGLRDFARGLDQLIIVEEKRALVEDQIRAHLYGVTSAPVIVGKRDETGAWMFPSNGDLNPDLIARLIGKRLLSATGDRGIEARLKPLADAAEAGARLAQLATRPPHFCPGCPHNTSTNVPEGSKAFAGIGCHYLVQPMERETGGFTHMGGEGANWIGLAPFSTTGHMFQNIGDGTYFHSGSLAVRAAVAAKVNITYKVLFNNAVAMTGGQPVDGELTVARVAAQMLAEGVARVVVVSDDPARHPAGTLPLETAVRPRDQLDAVQRELRDVTGVTALIYDQTCATELRRLRKRGKAADPELAVVINDLVCEGCGDCSRASNCLAVAPVETEFGRKRAVDLSTCNKDQSCIEGFCPSFVTVEGGRLRKPAMVAADGADLPHPKLPALDAPFSMVVTGIGGTGVVTIGALIGMGAHMDGLDVRVMDMTGLAQKGGSVVSHIQLARRGAEAIQAAKVAVGSAGLLIVCDLIVGAMPDNLARVSAGHGQVVANSHEIVTGLFTRDPDFAVPISPLKQAMERAVRPGCATFLDATALAIALLGDAVGANLFLVGFAWQRGLLPVSLEALERAIELNGVAVSLNRSAFTWGRRAALDRLFVERAAAGEPPDAHRMSASFEEAFGRRAAYLRAYQNQRYASRYTAIVARTAAAEEAVVPGQTSLRNAVARSLFRLMAYKDEYEVARLHTETGFVQQIAERFEGPYKIGYHLAPPLFAKRDKHTGRPRKSRYGPWMYQAFRLLARVRGLRGTKFDLFGYTAERRLERSLIEDYVKLLDGELLPALKQSNHLAAVELAEVAQTIRGFGHVKLSNIELARSRHDQAVRRFRKAGQTTLPEAEAEADGGEGVNSREDGLVEHAL